MEPEWHEQANPLRSVALAAAALIALASPALAAPPPAPDSTWNLNGTGDYNVGTNWSGGAVPTGTATFGVSTQNTVTNVSGDIDRWLFTVGASAYTFAISGTLSFNGAGIQINGGSAVINNGIGSFVNFYNASTAGNATITNNSFIFFYGTSSAGNATIINNFTLGFGGIADAGNATITTGNGAMTRFSSSSSGGNARIIINSGGLVAMPNLQTAGTTFGSIEGNGGTIELGSKILAVGSNGLSTTFAGTITDGGGGGMGGSLTKTGTGTLTLTGTNTYTGLTEIDGGTLQVSGSITSIPTGLVLVNSGGTLAGTGTVPIVFVGNGGTLAPGPVGSGTGTLTIQDTVLLCTCSHYAIKVSSTGNDMAHVVGGLLDFGTAYLDGSVSITSPTSSYRFKSPYTILSADGGIQLNFNGDPSTFASLKTPTGIAGVLSYTMNDVLLTLTSALGGIGSLNQNQRTLANTFDKLFNAGGSTGGLGGIFVGNISQNLTQASGEIATGTQTATFDAMGQFIGTMTDPFLAGRGMPANSGGAIGYASSDDAFAYTRKAPAEKAPFARVFTKAPPRNDLYNPRWSVWAAGFGGSQTTDGVATVGSNTTTSSLYGVAAGADYRLSPNTIAGFALAGGGTNFRVTNGGSGRSDLFQAGAFIRHNVGNAYISAAAAYGWQDVTTDRTVTIAGVDRLRANFNSNALTGRVEGGYRLVAPVIGGVGLTPYAAGQVTTVFLPSYSEAAIAGANTFALAYASRDVTATRSELGLRTDKSFALDTAILTLRGRAAWAHNFDPDRSINATFQTLPGASFTVNGAAQSRDTALASASAEWRWVNSWSAAATFDGEFSDRSRSYAGKGVVRYTW